ncbi:MAG: alkylation response protein AidB-like acyl-CoA dehydrogenase [Pseudohongiellaceae bacterium]|jgi:alkylation response protein AidB-like acyl-CoA dehydrogenase
MLMNSKPLSNNESIHFSEEQSMLLDSAREFCKKRSSIAAVRILLESEAGYNPDVWRELVNLGWMGIAIPEQFGGSGLTIGSAVPIAECMGKTLLSTPFISSTIAAQAIIRGGSDQQKRAYLPAIAGGNIITTALLENEDWGDSNVTVNAIADGDELILQGIKNQVQDAAVADFFIVSATVTGDKKLIIVPASTLNPKAINKQQLIDETKRCALVNFCDARVPASNVLPGDYDTLLRDIQLIAAMLLAAEATGSTAACLDLIVEYIKTRKQFGKIIGSYQALKHPTVDILCDMDSAKSFVYHAASIIDDGRLDDDAEIACRMAKAQASQALLFAGDRAVQFHGGMGFTYECDAQLYIRRAQWAQQVFGDASHHRKRLAGLLLG